MDLMEFVKARLDADEAAARAATPGPWIDASGNAGDVIVEQLSDADGHLVADIQACIDHPDIDRAADAEHIARHDPARVLRDVQATRRILDEHQHTVNRIEPVVFDPDTGEPDETNEPDYEVDCDVCGWASDIPTSGCQTLRLLASRWDDHPDYDRAWVADKLSGAVDDAGRAPAVGE